MGLRRSLPVLVALGLILVLVLVLFGQALSEPSPGAADEPVAALVRATSGQARVSYHVYTGKVRFLGTDLEHPFPQTAKLAASASSEESARQFLASYGTLFGLQDQAQELAVLRAKEADSGRTFVRFQQMHQGIPVVGAE